MKRILFMSALVLLISGSMMAKSKESKDSGVNATVISGKVLDQRTGELLAGVAVTVEGTNIKAYTDFDGRFIIRGIQPGTYTLTTSIISYEKLTVKDVAVTPGMNKEIKLSLTTEK
jgi:hypothetical protein